MKELRAVWRGYVNPACLNTASLRGTACPEFASGKQTPTLQSSYACAPVQSGFASFLAMTGLIEV